MRNLLFTRTIAVDPGTRTTLHPLHNVRFIDGSLNNGLNDSVLLKLFKRRHIHLDGRFLPNDLERMNVAPREIIHGFLSSDNASPFSFGCFSGRWWSGCRARSFAWKDTRLIHRVCRRSRRDRTRSTETLQINTCLIHKVEALNNVSIGDTVDVRNVLFLFLSHLSGGRGLELG